MLVFFCVSGYVDVFEYVLKLLNMMDKQIIDNGEEGEEGWEILYGLGLMGKSGVSEEWEEVRCFVG